MDLGKLAELSLGLAAFLGALFLLLKYKPWNGGRHKHPEVEESGKVEREVWEAFFKEEIRKDGEITRKVMRDDVEAHRRATREENEAQIEDIRKLLESRAISMPKDILEPILRDSEKTRDELRQAIKSAVDLAYQLGDRRRNPR